MNVYAQVLIPCKISKGMFDSEYAISIHLPNGSEVSLFADKALIQEVNGQPFLKVNVVQEDEGNGERAILLPSESFETGSRWVNMPTHSLAPA